MRPIDADAISVKSDIECVREVVEIILDNAPTLNAIVIPENATNGDMIKAIFPDLEWTGACKDVNFYFLDSKTPYSAKLNTFRDWWNAPYMESEVEDVKR